MRGSAGSSIAPWFDNTSSHSRSIGFIVRLLTGPAARIIILPRICGEGAAPAYDEARWKGPRQRPLRLATLATPPADGGGGQRMTPAPQPTVSRRSRRQSVAAAGDQNGARAARTQRDQRRGLTRD